MRHTPGSARSVIAGLPGIMLAVPFGDRFAIVPAVDINLGPEVLSARPKLAQFVRF